MCSPSLDNTASDEDQGAKRQRSVQWSTVQYYFHKSKSAVTDMPEDNTVG